MRKFLSMAAVAAVGLGLAACQAGQPVQQAAPARAPAMTAGGGAGGCEGVPPPMPGSGVAAPAGVVPTQNPSGGCEAIITGGPGVGMPASVVPTQNPAGGCESLPLGAAGQYPGCEVPTGGPALPARPPVR